MVLVEQCRGPVIEQLVLVKGKCAKILHDCAFLSRKHETWYDGSLGGKKHFKTQTHLQNTCLCILQTRIGSQAKMKIFFSKVCHVIYRWKAFFMLLQKNITIYI